MPTAEHLLPEKFYEGIAQFNRQEFFEAHETLETVWCERKAADRICIQGIIQIAAGCYHLKRGNIAGAEALFRKGLDKLEPFKPSYAGVDVERLIESVAQLLMPAALHKADNEVAIVYPCISILKSPC